MSVQRMLFFIFCICLCTKLFSQIGPGVSVVNACAPANITYTAPVGTTSFTWTFGTTTSSQFTNNALNVTSPSTFQAVFNGIVNGSPSSFTVQVNVSPKPVANFSIAQPTHACAVKTVTFTDLSTSTAPISNWLWVYGDGNQNSFSSNPTLHTHGYSAMGNMSVTLQVTDANGCDAQITLGTINVINSPTAIINSNPPNLIGCKDSLKVVFNGSGSQGTALSYSWDFGNGQTAQTAISPSITFPKKLTPYIVSLTVTSNGCTNTTTTSVVVSPATLSVNVSGTLCLGVPFTATITSNQPVTIWNLGDTIVAVSVTASPSTYTLPAYPTQGPFNFTVTAGSSPCVATPVIKQVYVEQVTANFIGSKPAVTCGSPFVVTYTGTSTPPAVSYQWVSWNQGAPITNSGNPGTLTFSYGSTKPYAIFFPPYVPTVSLIVTTAAGCTDTVAKALHTIEKPAAWFKSDKKEGCVPLTVTFSNTSIVYPSGPIISYTWCNNTPPTQSVTGNLQLPPNSNTVVPPQPFTYNQTGTYTPYLIIKTANNYTDVVNFCVDTSWKAQIIVKTPPLVNFSIPPGPFCPNQPVQITNNTPEIDSVQHWHVRSDFGFFSGCVSDPNPSWMFTHVGQHVVTLIGYKNSCADSATSSPITIKGPITEARYETNCVNRSSVNFSVELQEVATATLDFGDNTAPQVFSPLSGPGATLEVSTTHVYAASGDYTAVVTAVNPVTGCPASVYTMVVTVRDVVASFVGPVTACAGTADPYNATSSKDVLTGCGRGYLWYFDKLPPIETSSPILNYSFSNIGTHTVMLFVKDINSCVDSSMYTVLAGTVYPQFSVNTNTLCLSNGTIQITNTTPDLPQPITKFEWDFGDGKTYTTNVLQVPIHTYTTAGIPSTTYTLSLKATNSLKCYETSTMAITVYQPSVSFLASPDIFCLNAGEARMVTYTPQEAYQTYTIDYGIGGSATAITSGVSSHTYNTVGKYNVNIRIKDPRGCENSDSLKITAVGNPTANFIFSSPGNTGGNNICSGQVVTYTNITAPEQGTPAWDLGSGPLSNVSNTVSLFYASATTTMVSVTLSVTTGAPGYCTDTTSQKFTIHAFKGNIIASDSVICVGETVSFSITPDSHGLSAWVWSYGDATSSPTLFANSNPPALTYTSHVYADYDVISAGSRSASLIYWSGDMACRDAAVKVIQVNSLTPSSHNWDTTVVIGSPIPINIYPDKNVTFTWTSPTPNIECTTCIVPISNSTVDVFYTMTLEDINTCKIVAGRYDIKILPKASVDVPTAFTPNGDGKNDVIYVAGWGVRKLNYFKIFNRWGQLLFETDDLSQGWDGTYDGKPQNMETYIYQVSVETYLDSEPILEKSSTFKLIR